MRPFRGVRSTVNILTWLPPHRKSRSSWASVQMSWGPPRYSFTPVRLGGRVPSDSLHGTDVHGTDGSLFTQRAPGWPLQQGRQSAHPVCSPPNDVRAHAQKTSYVVPGGHICNEHGILSGSANALHAV